MPLDTVADEWSFKNIEEVFSAMQPGYITFDQFAAEIAESEGQRKNASISDAESIEPGNSQSPIGKFNAKLKLSGMINAITERSRKPGHLRTAKEVLTDRPADHEQEITLMLRNSGIPSERPNYRLSSSKTRRGVLNGNEPMAVAGLKNVYVDDDFFKIKDPPIKAAKVIAAIKIPEKVPDIISTAKQTSTSHEAKPTTSKLAMAFGEMPSIGSSSVDANNSEIPQAIGSSVKFYTPREVYEKRRFGVKNKVISIEHF